VRKRERDLMNSRTVLFCNLHTKLAEYPALLGCFLVRSPDLFFFVIKKILFNDFEYICFINLKFEYFWKFNQKLSNPLKIHISKALTITQKPLKTNQNAARRQTFWFTMLCKCYNVCFLSSFRLWADFFHWSFE
jgi:hypothetical protein